MKRLKVIAILGGVGGSVGGRAKRNLAVRKTGSEDWLDWALTCQCPSYIQSMFSVTLRLREWLPDKDSNLNKQSQNLLCYHYTIGQEEIDIRRAAVGRGDHRTARATNGAGDRNRTHNRLFTKQVLYR